MMKLNNLMIAALLVVALRPGVEAQKKKAAAKKQAITAYVTPSAAEIDRKVEALLAQMTLEEKVGQMAQITLDVIGKAENLEVSITLTNTGQREGQEVVHLYTSDLYASDITPDVKRLRRFEKVLLKPGESRTLSFTLRPEDLSYFNREGKKCWRLGNLRCR